MKQVTVRKEELIIAPLWWQLKRLQQTASGYGKKLSTEYKMLHEGRKYRVYYCCYSNSGTHYIIKKNIEITINIE